MLHSNNNNKHSFSFPPFNRIFGSKEKSLSAEELKARKDEENLFSDLPQLPTVIQSKGSLIDNSDSTSSAKRMRAE